MVSALLLSLNTEGQGEGSPGPSCGSGRLLLSSRGTIALILGFSVLLLGNLRCYKIAGAMNTSYFG